MAQDRRWRPFAKSFVSRNVPQLDDFDAIGRTAAKPVVPTVDPTHAQVTGAPVVRRALKALAPVDAQQQAQRDRQAAALFQDALEVVAAEEERRQQEREEEERLAAMYEEHLRQKRLQSIEKAKRRIRLREERAKKRAERQKELENPILAILQGRPEPSEVPLLALSPPSVRLPQIREEEEPGDEDEADRGSESNAGAAEAEDAPGNTFLTAVDDGETKKYRSGTTAKDARVRAALASGAVRLAVPPPEKLTTWKILDPNKPRRPGLPPEAIVKRRKLKLTTGSKNAEDADGVEAVTNLQSRFKGLRATEAGKQILDRGAALEALADKDTSSEKENLRAVQHKIMRRLAGKVRVYRKAMQETFDRVREAAELSYEDTELRKEHAKKGIVQVMIAKGQVR